jgi:hypothetical protein
VLCDYLKRINVAFDRISYRAAGPSVVNSRDRNSANIECDPDVNESKTVLPRKSCCALIRGTSQEIETLNPLHATPQIDISD